MISKNLRLLTLGAIIAGTTGIFAKQAFAQSPLEKLAERGQTARQRNPKVNLSAREGEPTTRLGFFSTDWATVLRKIAESTDKTLVMDRIPPGRFTRRDSREYSLDQAIQILNRELEKDAFRLIEKGEFLVVLELKAARSEYFRTELPATQPPTQSVASDSTKSRNEVQKYERKFESLAIPPRQGQSVAKSRGGIRQASHIEDGLADPNAELSAEAVDIDVVRVVKTRHSAREIARTIFAAYRDNAQLIENGPKGLPAFQVLESSAGGRDLLLPEITPTQKFSIGIDIDQGEER